MMLRVRIDGARARSISMPPHAHRAEGDDPMSSMRARDWTAENQAYLTAALARVRGALERHVARAPARAVSARDASPAVEPDPAEVTVPEGLSRSPR